MNAHVQKAPAQASTAGSVLVWRFLRRHPLGSYFLLAFVFTWAWEIPTFALWHQQVLGPWVILAPTLAGFAMAWVMEGRAGIIRLLRRFMLWRVGLPWYLVAVLLLPAIWFTSMAMRPGGVAALRIPDPAFALTYLSTFVAMFFTVAVIEEFGWHGFALPRLQERRGPLLGSLILGLLWGLWHLPLRALLPGLEGADTGLVAFAIAFLAYTAQIVALAILGTWVFNHARGSILLVTLLHASTNAAGGTIPGAFFPSLFPKPVIPTAVEVAMILVALLVVVATRGRLGYDQYLRDTALPAPKQAATRATGRPAGQNSPRW